MLPLIDLALLVHPAGQQDHGEVALGTNNPVQLHRPEGHLGDITVSFAGASWPDRDRQRRQDLTGAPSAP